jgi:hypothetical protein
MTRTLRSSTRRRSRSQSFWPSGPDSAADCFRVLPYCASKSRQGCTSFVVMAVATARYAGSAFTCGSCPCEPWSETGDYKCSSHKPQGRARHTRTKRNARRFCHTGKANLLDTLDEIVLLVAVRRQNHKQHLAVRHKRCVGENSISEHKNRNQTRENGRQYSRHRARQRRAPAGPPQRLVSTAAQCCACTSPGT